MDKVSFKTKASLTPLLKSCRVFNCVSFNFKSTNFLTKKFDTIAINKSTPTSVIILSKDNFNFKPILLF
ncbi:MAG: hypothetical protein CVU80_02665 [Elusimicrobia bacterium HGW-Elusimicrobia-4]|nr:MAG: hypothetical protein CVU80_02665 [Elusimicrobia bacterium HGW-Elusimicrobia-4]